MDDSAAIETWQVRVHGRVQGVGFREGCERHARQLGVTGWVRNRLDGTVELLAQADARVTGIDVSTVPGTTRYDGFEQRPTQ